MSLVVDIPAQDVTVTTNYQVVTHTLVTADALYSVSTNDGSTNVYPLSVTIDAPDSTVVLGGGVSFNSGFYNDEDNFYITGLWSVGIQSIWATTSESTSEIVPYINSPASDGSAWNFQGAVAAYVNGSWSTWVSEVDNFGTVYAIFASL